MTRKSCFTQEEIKKAQALRDRAQTPQEIRRALSVLLTTEARVESSEAARILGISERSLFRYRDSFRVQESPTRSTWGGRRRAFMTPEQEEEFLAPWLQKGKEGGVLTVPPIHAALVEKLGRPLPLSTTYRLLARHGWRKVEPDTKHSKSLPEAQED